MPALSPICERWATWVRVERPGRRGEGGGRTAERRFSIHQHPPHAAALSFADAISAATSAEGASAPVGVVFAAAPHRAPPRWHRRLTGDRLKGGLLLVAGGEKKRREGEREKLMLKVINALQT
jgi:hypothetical protein